MIANGLEKFASIICAGPQLFAIAVLRLGIAINIASRNIAPMMNAPADGREHGFRRGAARVLRLFSERGRGIHPVDNEEAHEHGEEERAESEVQTTVFVTMEID